MPNLVQLSTLITRVQQRAGTEGNTGFITPAEITDCLNASLATEVYDLVRQSQGDNYYRKTVTFTTTNGTANYTFAAVGANDFLSIISVDAYLSNSVSPSAPKLNCRRYFEEQRNAYTSLPLGWSIGQWILYSVLQSSFQFQPIPDSAYAIGINYVPVAPQLVNPTDTWDDINGWSELAVLDAASKCLLKAKRLEEAQYCDARRLALKQEIRAVIPMRNAEPEGTHFYNRQSYGDGWESFGGGWP